MSIVKTNIDEQKLRDVAEEIGELGDPLVRYSELLEEGEVLIIGDRFTILPKSFENDSVLTPKNGKLNLLNLGKLIDNVSRIYNLSIGRYKRALTSNH